MEVWFWYTIQISEGTLTSLNQRGESCLLILALGSPQKGPPPPYIGTGMPPERAAPRKGLPPRLPPKPPPGGLSSSCVALGKMFGMTFFAPAPARARLQAHALRGVSTELCVGWGPRKRRLHRKSYLGQRKTKKILPAGVGVWYRRREEVWRE